MGLAGAVELLSAALTKRRFQAYAWWLIVAGVVFEAGAYALSFGSGWVKSAEIAFVSLMPGVGQFIAVYIYLKLRQAKREERVGMHSSESAIS
jgi:hypothetical protein